MGWSCKKCGNEETSVCRNCEDHANPERIARKNDGGPAFPSGTVIKGGMSLRDYMATHIISGVLANHLTVLSNKDPMGSIKTLCATAYLLADNLLEAREAKHE